jgi:predicted DNA-binding transcriptional regulator AlpA
MPMTDGNLPTSEDRQLTAKEVAALIGISVDSVYRHIPCIRIGRTIRYSEVDVRQFLAKNTLPCARHLRSRFVLRKRRL